MESGYNIQALRERRKKLRKRETKAEKYLWQYVRNNKLGTKFYRQYSVQNYIVDFYCSQYRIAIELDGEYHENNEAKLNDLSRTKFLESQNITVIRFKNEEVFEDTASILEKIKTYLHSPS